MARLDLSLDIFFFSFLVFVLLLFRDVSSLELPSNKVLAFLLGFRPPFPSSIHVSSEFRPCFCDISSLDFLPISSGLPSSIFIGKCCKN